MENKQTAVEWFFDKLKNHEIQAEHFKLYQQAKEMEREQIEDAYGHGQNNGYMYANQKAITIRKDQYYDQTFKSE